MDLEALERIHFVDFFNTRMMEFVSDHKRILLRKKFPENDLPELKKSIEKILVSV